MSDSIAKPFLGTILGISAAVLLVWKLAVGDPPPVPTEAEILARVDAECSLASANEGWGQCFARIDEVRANFPAVEVIQDKWIGASLSAAEKALESRGGFAYLPEFTRLKPDSDHVHQYLRLKRILDEQAEAAAREREAMAREREKEARRQEVRTAALERQLRAYSRCRAVCAGPYYRCRDVHGAASCVDVELVADRCLADCEALNPAAR